MVVEDKVIGGMLQLGKYGLKIKCYTQNGYIVKFEAFKSPELTTIGISNLTQDGRYVLFMDYDDIREEDLQIEINRMIRDYGISHFLILKTSKMGYHVISFDKFKLSHIKNILNNSLCDYSYKNIPLKSDKGYILRIFEKRDLDGRIVKEKPQFHNLKINMDLLSEREKSRAHYELYCLLFKEVRALGNIKAFADNLDSYHTVKVVKYGTSNSDFMKMIGFDKLDKSKKVRVEWLMDNLL
jgi:hypothetical protein